jgi:Fur family peroxide stress response transcriptional regulator
LHAIKSSQKHPTAEEVYKRVLEDIPNVSLTTVYRNLNRLAEQGIIKRLLIPNRPDRFEKNPDKHYHICCEICGRFEDLTDIEYDFELDDAECKSTGFLIKSHEIIFSGICADCRKIKKTK